MDPRYQSKARAKLPEEDVFVTVSLRMSRAMRDDMAAQAKWKGVSRSEYMRGLLDDGMGRTAREMALEVRMGRLRAPQRVDVPSGVVESGCVDPGLQNGSYGPNRAVSEQLSGSRMSPAHPAVPRAPRHGSTRENHLGNLGGAAGPPRVR